MPTITAEIREHHPARQTATENQVRRLWPDAEPVDPDAGVWNIDVSAEWVADLEREGYLDAVVDGLRVWAEMP